MHGKVVPYKNIRNINGQYRNEMYNRAENMVPQLDGTYNVSDDSDTDLHSYLDLAIQIL